VTIPAYHALALLIRADLELFEEISDQLHGCLKACHDSQCDLVGIVACHDGMAMAFIADQLGIREMEQRINALKEFPTARFYVCRGGKAVRCDSHVFFQEMWLEVIENAKGKA